MNRLSKKVLRYRKHSMWAFLEPVKIVPLEPDKGSSKEGEAKGLQGEALFWLDECQRLGEGG